RQLRVPEGAAIILLPARISRIKGHMYLLDAIAALKRRDVFCVFLGSDINNESYRRELDDYISAKELGGQVRIETKCDDMPAAYMISTVVAVPSLVPEGFGRVPIEAQAMGRPCIATDHGGARETIIREETGWLVPVADVPAMTEALQEAMSLDARGRAMLATAAMNHVATHFTNEQMCRATLDVYAEVLGQSVLQAQMPRVSNAAR
ncbi:MAG: glycosyltransferase family 4 protein, partial [Alphaproteobacteria bacterium]|nr:glycosyltransferase family 4 protein [Alphaproteobacteria bacterium]